MNLREDKRRNLVRALDCCLDVVRSGRWACACIGCPYSELNHCRELMLLNAIDLLKEPIPPAEPETSTATIVNKYWAICGQCGGHYRLHMMPNEKAKYCPRCGKKLEYEP